MNHRGYFSCVQAENFWKPHAFLHLFPALPEPMLQFQIRIKMEPVLTLQATIYWFSNIYLLHLPLSYTGPMNWLALNIKLHTPQLQPAQSNWNPSHIWYIHTYIYIYIYRFHISPLSQVQLQVPASATALAASSITGYCTGSKFNYRLLHWQRVPLQVTAFVVSSNTAYCISSEFNYRLPQ